MQYRGIKRLLTMHNNYCTIVHISETRMLDLTVEHSGKLLQIICTTEILFQHKIDMT